MKRIPDRFLEGAFLFTFVLWVMALVLGVVAAALGRLSWWNPAQTLAAGAIFVLGIRVIAALDARYQARRDSSAQPPEQGAK